MQALILAGGNANRLYPPSFGVPKPMLPVFDRPVMEHGIRLLARHGITDVIVTLSSAAMEIPAYFGDGSRWGVRIRYSVEDAPLGSAGALRLAQGIIDGTFVVISGDTVTDADLRSAVAFHRSSSAIATLLLYTADDPSDFGLVRLDADGRITRFLEKPRSTEVFTNTISAGIYVMEPDALSCIPHGQERDIALHVLPGMLNNGEPVYGFPISGYWCDVGGVAQYRNVHFDALEGRLKLDLPAVHIGEGVWLGEGADIHSSVTVSPPAYVGKGSCVRRGAALGGRVVLGEDVMVDEGARIVRSVIGKGSLVGRNTRITDCMLGSGHSIAEGEEVSDRTLVTADDWASRRQYTPIRTEPTRVDPGRDQTGEIRGRAA